jgi:ubiquinone/menaquinone biosynthesis C-methylase UbiE
MSKIADQDYLLKDQYRDSANLDARVRLHVLFSINKQGWNRWYFDQLDLPPNARILELGCGPGYLWRDNVDRIPSDWDITLSDFSAGMIDQARANLQTAQSGHLHPLRGRSAVLPNPRPAAESFRFEIIDAQSIPYDANTFDAVIANHMLYHVPDRARALSEMRRVLTATGKAYLATNGDQHLAELYDLTRRFSPQTSLGWGARAHDMFSIDTGDAEVRPWFPAIEVRRYDDALIVTEAAPLADYILSMATPEVIAQRRAELTTFIEGEMQAKGAIHITKDSGLFIAQP